MRSWYDAEGRSRSPSSRMYTISVVKTRHCLSDYNSETQTTVEQPFHSSVPTCTVTPYLTLKVRNN